MANHEHIAQLFKGVAAWNAWRDENPNIRPDLFQLIFAGLRSDLIRIAKEHGIVRADTNWEFLRQGDLSCASRLEMSMFVAFSGLLGRRVL